MAWPGGSGKGGGGGGGGDNGGSDGGIIGGDGGDGGGEGGVGGEGGDGGSFCRQRHRSVPVQSIVLAPLSVIEEKALMEQPRGNQGEGYAEVSYAHE